MLIFSDMFNLSKNEVKIIEEYLNLKIVNNNFLKALNNHLTEFNIELKHGNNWFDHFIETIKTCIVISYLEELLKEKKIDDIDYEEYFGFYLDNIEKFNKILSLENLKKLNNIIELSNLIDLRKKELYE